MHSWLPADVGLETDVSDASWVVEQLRPWGVTYPQPVACFLPDIYESYARLPHPSREYTRTDDGSVVVDWTRWSELGARRGVALGATTRWEEVSGFPPQSGPDGIDDPYEGSMPDVLVEVVTDFLRQWTTTPDKIWFGMWEGNGTWWKGAHAVLTLGDDRDRSAELLRIDDERDRVLRATPTFGTPERQYFLMSGPLSAASTLTDAAGGTSPSLWWPDDRGWFVSTEVDGLSTYVGGKASMIDALIASSEIEAVLASPDSPLI
jgi:hypothetical protein